MTRTAIILAAGHAARFHGTIKELLPISDTESVIDCSINAARVWRADRIIIVSNSRKIQFHARHFEQDKYRDLNIVYKINDTGEMWQSLCKGMEDATEQNAMFMADTVFNREGLLNIPAKPLSFGTFLTYAPQNYSVFRNGAIVTKDSNLYGTGLYDAWGCVLFDKTVVDYWKNDLYADYDTAFNDALGTFEYGTFSIDMYHDIGTLGRYIEYLNEHYT